MGFWAKVFGLERPASWPVHVDDANFEAEVYRAELPVLLDVWGPDCVPCKQLEGVIVRLARAYHGRVKVCELNAAASTRVSRRLGVRGTPTVLYFDGRVEVARVVGFRGEHYHREIIERELLPRRDPAPERGGGASAT